MDQELRLSSMIMANQEATQQMILKMGASIQDNVQTVVNLMGNAWTDTMSNVVDRIKERTPSTPKRKTNVKLLKQQSLTKFSVPQSKPGAFDLQLSEHDHHQQQVDLPPNLSQQSCDFPALPFDVEL